MNCCRSVAIAPWVILVNETASAPMTEQVIPIAQAAMAQLVAYLLRFGVRRLSALEDATLMLVFIFALLHFWLAATSAGFFDSFAAPTSGNSRFQATLHALRF